MASYSPVRRAGRNGAAGLSAASQPFGPEFTLTLHAARLVDSAAGNKLLMLNNLSALPAGLYVVPVAWAGQSVRWRVVRQ